jgi:hypothetical protein
MLLRTNKTQQQQQQQEEERREIVKIASRARDVAGGLLLVHC